jgi:hypothetical protein
MSMDSDEDIDFGHRGPALRATIAGGQVTLNPHLSGTICGGPAAMTFGRLEGVVLVDLAHAGVDDDELVATVPPNAPPVTVAARRALAEWAALVGYRRLWLPDGVLELEPPPPVGTAAVRCPTCTSVWADDSTGFWATVRANGHFPGYCPACSGSLPEWQPVRAGVTRARRRDREGAQPVARTE